MFESQGKIKWNSNSKELISVLNAKLKSREIVESCDAKHVEREDESFAKLSSGKFDEIETPKEQKALGFKLENGERHSYLEVWQNSGRGKISGAYKAISIEDSCKSF